MLSSLDFAKQMVAQEKSSNQVIVQNAQKLTKAIEKFKASKPVDKSAKKAALDAIEVLGTQLTQNTMDITAGVVKLSGKDRAAVMKAQHLFFNFQV